MTWWQKNTPNSVAFWKVSLCTAKIGILITKQKMEIPTLPPKTIDFTKFKSLIPVVILVVFCSLRFGFFVCGNDFGWDFEVANRLLQGQRYGIEYFSTVPPLSYRLVETIFRVTSPKLLTLNFLLYLIWSSNVILTFLILFPYVQNKRLLSFAICVGAVSSVPHMVAVNLYNHLSIFLLLLSILLVAQFHKQLQFRWIPAIAMFSGPILFTKQPIGIFSTSFLACSLICDVWHRTHSKRKALNAFLLFSLFAMISMLLTWKLVASHLSLETLTQLMFKDATTAKGGFFGILAMAVPRVGFPSTFTMPNLRRIEFGLTLVSYLAISGILYAQIRKPGGKNSPKLSHFASTEILGLTLILLIGTLIFGQATWEFIVNLRELGKLKIYAFVFTRILLTYCLFALIAVVFFVCDRKELMKRRFFLWFALLGWLLTIAFQISSIKYQWTTSLITIPISIIALIEFHLISERALKWTARTIPVFLILFFYSPDGVGEFTRVTHPLASGLFANREITRKLSTYEEFTPFVKHKTTLWLLKGGPTYLTGSIPVASVANLHNDQYSARIESMLLDQWKQNPPERIVIGAYYEAENSHIWKSELPQWMKNNYVKKADLTLGELYFRN